MSSFNRLNPSPGKLLLLMRVKAFSFLYIVLFLTRIAFGQEPLVWPDQYVVTFAQPTIFPQAVAPNVDISGTGTTFAVLVPSGTTSGPVVPLAANQAFNLCDAMGPAALAAAGIVECSPNYLMTSSDSPNDPYYVGGYEADLPAIRALQAVDTQMSYLNGSPTSAPVVAIIDTGIDYNHPDLAANMWTNPGEIAGNGADDDGDGSVDNMHGVDIVNGDGNPMDDHGHGTHCAGTVAAVRNNGVGMAGIATGTKLMAVKVLAASGSGSFAGIIAGINFVTAKKNYSGVNVRVINMSLGGQIPAAYAGPLCSAMLAADNAGIAVIVAAGNSAANNNVSDYYPANCAEDNNRGLSAAAVNNSGVLAYFSNYGSVAVALAAPGVSTLSTALNGGYANMSGTSMAAPHVAGVAALLFETFSSGLVSANDVVNAIKAGVQPIAGLVGKVSTGGMLDANGALNSLISSSGSPPSGLPNPSPAPAAPDPVNYTVSLLAAGSNASKLISGKTVKLKLTQSAISSSDKDFQILYEVYGKSCSGKIVKIKAGATSSLTNVVIPPLANNTTIKARAYQSGALVSTFQKTLTRSTLKSALKPNQYVQVCRTLTRGKIAKTPKKRK